MQAAVARFKCYAGWPPIRTMKSATPWTPWRFLMLVNTKWPIAAHAPRVAFHHAEIGADQRREVDLVDHQEIGAGDAGPRAWRA
jgi:hypothetical protein